MDRDNGSCSPSWGIYFSWVCLCTMLALFWQLNGPAHHKWTWAEVLGSEIVRNCTMYKTLSRKYEICGKTWMNSQAQGEKCAYSIERRRWRCHCFHTVFPCLWFVLDFICRNFFSAANFLKFNISVNHSIQQKRDRLKKWIGAENFSWHVPVSFCFLSWFEGLQLKSEQDSSTLKTLAFLSPSSVKRKFKFVKKKNGQTVWFLPNILWGQALSPPHWKSATHQWGQRLRCIRWNLTLWAPRSHDLE